jgi:hypothetical protein
MMEVSLCCRKASTVQKMCDKERKRKKKNEGEEVRREARAERAKKKRRTATVACFMLGEEQNGGCDAAGVAFVLVWRRDRASANGTFAHQIDTFSALEIIGVSFG